MERSDCRISGLMRILIRLFNLNSNETPVWAINEKPTGSGDPYQLRRAALGGDVWVVPGEKS